MNLRAPMTAVFLASLACALPPRAYVLVLEQGKRSTCEIDTAQYSRCDDRTVIYLSALDQASPNLVDADVTLELFLFVGPNTDSGFLIMGTQSEVPGVGVPVTGTVELKNLGGGRVLDLSVKTLEQAPRVISSRDLSVLESQDVCKRLQAPFYGSRNPWDGSK